jgi:tetratricopeptide (TPR) repeat protein
MRRLVYYALAFVFLVCLVVFITWQIGYINNFANLVVVTGLATVGVAGVMALFVPIIEKRAEPHRQPPQDSTSPKFHSEVTQSGGVHFGRGSTVSVSGSVIGSLELEGIPPEKAKEVLEGLEQDQIPPPLHQLEPPPADFTGREEELETLLSSVKSGGVVISGVYGMGGVGKTAFALKLAEQIKPHYPDAQIYLNLRGTDPTPLSPEEALAYVVRSFHPLEKLPRGDELKAFYRSGLHGKRVLLLMDNARDASQVEDLIPPADSILLITSRQHFTLPGLKELDLDKMPGEKAKELILKIVPRLGDLADNLARLCDYLPLALRVSASTLRERPDLSPTEYLQQLQDLSKRLELTGVEASLRLSYELLPQNLQKYWRSLAVFPGSFDRRAAAYVWDRDPDLSRQALSDLRARSLLEYSLTTRRYELHDLARLLADKLLTEDERAFAAMRHAAYFLTVLRISNSLYQKGNENILSALSLFDLEWKNIQTGQAWASVNAARDDQAAQFCKDYPDAGVYVLDLRLHRRDLIRWLEAALLRSRETGDREGERNQLGNLGSAYRALGQVEQAIECHQQALEISREIGDRRGEGTCLGGLGGAYHDLGKVEWAMEYHQQALEISREIGDRRGEGPALGNLGNAYHDLGKVKRAIEYYEGALEISREIGDRSGEGTALGNLGNAYYDLGQVEQAIECHQQALEISREIGERRGEGTALGNLGNAYRALGQVEQAIECHQQALEISREIGDRRGEGACLGNLGDAYRALGQVKRAIEYSKQALAISRETGYRYGEGCRLDTLGLAHADLGQVERAIECYEQALEVFQEIGYRHNGGEVLQHLGQVYGNIGQREQAIECYEGALQIFTDLQSPDVEEVRDRLAELKGRGNTLDNQREL